MSLPGNKKYKLVSHKEVDGMMKDGWLPWGSPLMVGDNVVQAMITEEVLDGYVDAVVPRASNIFKNRGR